MKSVITEITVEWGHCDPAGIVFYPNFFTFFDSGAWNLFISAGLGLDILRSKYGAVGFPVVDSRSDFRYPCRLKDHLVLTTEMEAIHSKTFVMNHTLYNGEMLAAHGREVRILGLPHPEDPKRLRASAIPKDLARQFKD